MKKVDLQLYEAINNTLDFCDQLDSLGFGMNQYGYFISTKEALRASLACYFINLANMDGFVSKEELDFINIYLSEFFSYSQILQLVSSMYEEDYFTKIPSIFEIFIIIMYVKIH